MQIEKNKWVLASNSPRRKELLEKHGVVFEVIAENIQEKQEFFLTPSSTCMSLAFQKGLAVAEKHPHRKILSADTVVFCEGKLLGKPLDEEDAFGMLKLLNGKIQYVLTGFSLLCLEKGIKKVDFDVTEIKFSKISDEKLRAYLATGDYKDKAGAYGIQSGAFDFVDYIKGDLENVIGLPTKKVLKYMVEIDAQM